MEYAPDPASRPTPSPFDSFAGRVLVLPVVSHGNVGQLALDLVINTARFDRVGFLDHPALLPCLGVGAYDTAGTQLALGMEVYAGGDDFVSGASGVVLVQQRSEAVLGAQAAFAEATAEWIKAAGFERVVVAASMPSTAAKAPGQIGGTRFRHVSVGCASPEDADEKKTKAKALSDLVERCERAGVSALEPEMMPEGAGVVEGGEAEAGKDGEEGGAPVHHAMLPPWSLLRACRAVGVDATCLLAICSEGDNSADAAGMANAVAAGLQLTPRAAGEGDGGKRIGAWAVPPSWAAAYGYQPLNRAMFT